MNNNIAARKPFDYIAEIAGRAVLALFYFNMLWKSVQSFLQYHNTGVMPYIILQALVIGFALFRNSSSRLSLSIIDWLVAILPTLMPFVLIRVDNGPQFAGMILQYFGVVILIGGVISLNSSLGIIPADRGIKSDGLYKIIRHPLFLGYIIANIGVLLGNLSLHNFLCVAGGVILQLVRIGREEKFLASNADYQQYKLATRWRLLPGIW